MASRLFDCHERANDGRHPTANSVAFIRETRMLVGLNARRVMPGVRLPSIMISTETAFEQILEAIGHSLAQSGFSKVEERSHPEAFGSRYTTFGDGKEFIRLTWDGKEGWFVLESIPTSSVTFESGWADILLQFFKPQQDGASVVTEIAQDMREALCAYLGVAE